MRRNRYLALAAFLSTAALPAQVPSAPPSAAPPQQAAAPAAAPVREPGLYAVLTTSEGTIALKLFEAEAPATVKNFVDLALGRKRWRDPKAGAFTTRPLYNGTTFHRVIPGFMIQGGDPAGSGRGDPGFVIPDEFHPALRFDQPGRLGMANAGPKTGNCQFFITEVPTPHLDGLHTIFGQVVEGQEVVNAIARVPRNNEDNKPLKPVRIVKAEIQRVGPSPPNAPEGKPAPAAKKAAPTTKKAPATPTSKKAATTPASKKPAATTTKK